LMNHKMPSMKIAKIPYLICIFLSLQINSFAQAPANNNCPGTNIPVVAGSSISSSGTLENATQTIPPSSVCDAPGIANVANDVWFSFTAVTSSVTIIVTPEALQPPLIGLDPAVEIFQGSCALNASIRCRDYGTGIGQPEVIRNLSVNIGSTYYIRVYHFTEISRRPGTPNFTISVESIGAPPLPAPTNLTATVSNNSDINVRWNAVTGATRYDLYDDNGTIVQQNISNTSFTHPNRPPGDHCYQVKACNNAGSCSNYSNQGCATIIDNSPPVTPTNLNARGISCSEIEVSWTAIRNAASYKLYNAAGTLLETTTSTSYTHTGRTFGTQSCYKIKAVNGFGESALSTQSCGSPIIAAPIVDASIVSSSKIRLTWQPVCGASKYFVYNSNGQLLSNVNGITATTFTVIGLTANQQHCFTVKACNTNGSCSALSNPVCETTTLRYVDIGDIRFTGETIVADANEEVFTLTGNVSAGLISQYPTQIVKFTGTVRANVTNFTFSGSGTITILRGLNGVSFQLLDRTFNYSVVQSLSTLLTNEVKCSYKLAGLELELKKVGLIPFGANIQGKLEFPIGIKGLSDNVPLRFAIEELQVRQDHYPAIATELNLGNIAFKRFGLENTKVNYSGIEHTLSGSTTIKTPAFKLKGGIAFKNSALESVEIQYTPIPAIPLGATGLSIQSLGGSLKNMTGTQPLEMGLRGSFVPTLTDRLGVFQLDVNATYALGTSFEADGHLSLFNRRFANAGFGIYTANNEITKVNLEVGIEFCVIDAVATASIANRSLLGGFSANLKMPCDECLSLPIPNYIKKPLLALFPCGQKFITSKNFLQNKHLAGYAKVRFGSGWKSLDLELYYGISANGRVLGHNYRDLPADFRNHFAQDPFRPIRMAEDTTWYAYNVNHATQSLIIEAFGGRMDLPKFWIRTPNNDTITRQNIETQSFVTHYENANEHYAAYYFKNPRNGDYFIGVINADSIKVNSALVRPSMEITNVQHNPNNRTFTIDWKDECPDRDALISLGYSTNTEGKNQVLFADSLSENSTTDRYVWQYGNPLKSGQYYFWAVIQDSIGLFRTVYYKTPFTVTAQNTPPPPSNLAYSLQQDTITLNWNGNNPYPITYIVYYSHQPNTVSTDSKNFAVINDTTCSYNNFVAGRYFEFIVTALDTFGNESAPSNPVNFVFHPTNVNNAPFITTVKTKDITYLGRTYSTTIAAQDLDNHALTYRLQSNPSGMTINATTGQISWTPNANSNHLGLHTIKVKVTDGHDGVDSIEYQVHTLDTNGATAVAQFNKALYIGYNDQASIYVRDDDFNGSATVVDSFAVRIHSTADPVGFVTNMTEIGLESNEFVVHFGFDNSSSGNGRLRVNLGDTIWMTFTDRSMQRQVTEFSYFSQVKADFKQPTFICAGDSLRFENKSTGSGLKYAWDFGDGGFSQQKHPMHPFQPIYGGSPRIFNVSLNITDNDGRTSSIQKPITIIPLPIPLFGDTVSICDSARLDAGNPNSQYLWHNQATTQQIRLDSSQQITVRIINPQGCMHTDTAFLRVRKVKTTISNQGVATCEGKDGFITLQTTGGSNNYRYAWADTLISNQPNYQLSAGNYTITVTDTIYGCITKQQATIVLNNNLTADSITSVALRCFGDNNGSLTSRVSVPRTIYYRWNDTNRTNTLRNLAAGNYTVTITTPGRCTTTRTGIVTQPPKLSIDTVRVTATLCTPASGIATAQVSGGVSGYQYRWNNGQNTAALRNLVNGNYTLTLTDANNCQTNKSISVTQVMPKMTATFSKTDLRCHGDGNGQIKIENVNGGWGAPYSYSLNDVGYTYALRDGYKWLSGGSYVVYIKDKDGCKISDSIQIYEPPQVTLDAGAPKTIDLGASVQLEGLLNLSLPMTWKWTPIQGLSCSDCQMPIANPLQTTVYKVTATDGNGCSVQDAVDVHVINRRRVYVPTNFSPNGDGKNDIFTIFGGKEVKEIRKFEIFNRWGSKLFSVEHAATDDPTQGWDGTFNGQPVDTGDYIFVAEIEYINGELELFKNSVTIVR
jgi:gliding motility-associated-like protein